MKPTAGRVWILRATNGYARWMKFYKGPNAVGDAIHDVEQHIATANRWQEWTFTLVSGRMFL